MSDQAKAAAQLEREIDAIREDMTDVAEELEQRREQMPEVANKTGRVALAVAGGALVLATGVLVWRRRRLTRAALAALRLRRDLRRIVALPREQPGVVQKVLAGTLTAVASTFAKTMTERALAPRLAAGDQR